MIMRIASAIFRARPSRRRPENRKIPAPLPSVNSLFLGRFRPKNAHSRPLTCLFECWHDFFCETSEEVPIEGRAHAEDHLGRPGVCEGAEAVPDGPCAPGQDGVR